MYSETTTDGGTAVSTQNRPTILNIGTRGRMSTTGCTELHHFAMMGFYESWSNNSMYVKKNLMRLGLGLHASSLS